jgi:hypothetical protein
VPAETLFMIYGSTVETGGAYATFSDVAAAVLATQSLSTLGDDVEGYVRHTYLDFSANAGNDSNKEANTDHDYRYPILGNTYTDAFFRSIGSVAAANTKTAATPALAIDLAGYRLKTGTGSPAAWGSTPRFIVDDTTEASSTDAALRTKGGMLVDSRLYVGNATAAEDAGGAAPAVTVAGGMAVTKKSTWSDGVSSVLTRITPGGTYAAEIQGHYGIAYIGGDSSHPVIRALGKYSYEVQLCDGTYAVNVVAGDVNLATGLVVKVNGTQVLKGQEAAVADAAGGATVDAEARTAINGLLAKLRNHGLIAT